MKKIQTGDKVMIVAGADKGVISTVVSVSLDKVIVKGVNTVKKATKGEGFVKKDLPIHVSNIALYDEKSKIKSRVGIRIEKGKKVRFYKKTNKIIKK